MKSKTLADLTVGQTAQVTGVDGADAIGVRLLEMGLAPGVEVTYINSALMGDPLEFELRGYRLSLRRTEAARVSIELLAADV
ncbi:FeoA family protein [Lignipirellula cremea]|uniref:FeoA domain protein n=1 Tax=Lignipirellula cremea TaxID=2528010 RepID=A0A518E0E8_9BACT|nr:ferrous iron transport protein A [Lignipirellula cremea]QDU97562.1 FeoA domain protein [Lignipirellula cremea]